MISQKSCAVLPDPSLAIINFLICVLICRFKIQESFILTCKTMTFTFPEFMTAIFKSLNILGKQAQKEYTYMHPK